MRCGRSRHSEHRPRAQGGRCNGPARQGGDGGLAGRRRWLHVADGAEPKCPKLMHQMMQEDGDIRVSGAILRKADQPRSAIIKLKKLCHRSHRVYPGEDSLADNSVCIRSMRMTSLGEADVARVVIIDGVTSAVMLALLVAKHFHSATAIIAPSLAEVSQSGVARPATDLTSFVTSPTIEPQPVFLWATVTEATGILANNKSPPPGATERGTCVGQPMWYGYGFEAVYVGARYGVDHERRRHVDLSLIGARLGQLYRVDQRPIIRVRLRVVDAF
jgi:hypothetical protein